ncbi:hypothetical protein [Aliidiomarina indica]|uniref:hypothetical protein n=1 Tax=Aliidiomarina indica TaxID=2749147 RepID=UPI001890509D|nr:hypothetical protein [Aliidiomarina indica]
MKKLIFSLVMMLTACSQPDYGDFCTEFYLNYGHSDLHEEGIVEQRQEYNLQYLEFIGGGIHEISDFVEGMRLGETVVDKEKLQYFGPKLISNALFIEDFESVTFLLESGVEPFERMSWELAPAVMLLAEDNWLELLEKADEATEGRYAEKFDQTKRYGRVCLEL